MTPDELAALSAAAKVLDTGTAWKPTDFWDTDPDWQDALATAANAFPRLVAEVLRLQAGLADLRIDHRDCYDPSGRADDPAYPCECGANAHNARIDALMACRP